MALFDLFRKKQEEPQRPSQKASHKVVDSKIRSLVWPELREKGFLEFTSRTAWRSEKDRIHVLTFRSFDTHTASIIGCTTYSLSISLGCYFKKIPNQYGHKTKMKKGLLLPEEYECHFRRSLFKTIDQKDVRRGDIWSIERTGRNLEMVFNDIQKVVRAEAFPWFERYAGDEEVLRTLLHDKEKNQGGLSVGTWGIGNIPSPWRDYLTGYVALGMGQKELAWTHLSRALNSGCYKKVESRIKKDLAS